MKRLLCYALLAILMMSGPAWAVMGVNTPAANTPRPVWILSQSAIPFIKASSGSIGNNCAITGMTALPRTYSNGAYLYLPASAISAGSAAGWYWFVASSTTAGTCYNSIYTSGTPVIGTTTAFATTGPGAYTGSIATITAVSLTVPANALGPNGRLEASASAMYNNNANNKISALVFGASTCWTTTVTTQVSSTAICTVANRGLATIQSLSYFFGLQTSVANGTAQAVDGTENTAANVTLEARLSTAVATDHSILEHYRVQILYAP